MRLIAIDTETELIPGLGTKVRTVYDTPTMVCLSVSDGVATSVYDDADPVIGTLLKEWLEDDAVCLLFHHAAFDIAVLERWGGMRGLWERKLRAGLVLDTIVLHHAREIRPVPRTLAYLARTVCGITLTKGDVRTSFRHGEPLSDEQLKYAARDAYATHAVATRLLSTPPGGLTPRKYERVLQCRETANLPPSPVPGATPLDRLYSTAQGMLAFHLQPHGIAVDQEILDQRLAEAEEVYDKHARAMLPTGLIRRGRAKVEPTTYGRCPKRSFPRKWTWAHNRELWQREVGNAKEGYRLQTVPPDGWHMETKLLLTEYSKVAKEHRLDPPLTGGGEISLEYDYWKQHRAVLPPPLLQHLDLLKARGRLIKYLYPLKHAQATRVYPSYHIPGAPTHRWACSKPSLQQVMGHLRPLYTADPDRVFVYCDYPTLELYTLAECMHAMGIDGPLMAALRSGADIHTHTAAMLRRISLEEVTPDQRQKAKATNFGMPGGLGQKTLYRSGLKDGLDWSWEEAGEEREGWLRHYADVAQFLGRLRFDPFELCPQHFTHGQWLSDLGFEDWPSRFDLQRRLENGEVYTCALPTGAVRPRRYYSQAANIFFQHVGAVVCTRAFLNCLDADLDPRIVVHDSIHVQCREAEVDRAGPALVKCMADALHTVCPNVPIPLEKFEWTSSTHML